MVDATLAAADAPLLRVDAVSRHFSVKRGWFNRQRLTLKAVDGVSFDVRPGETLAIVGESGCGKSTLARLMLGLDQPSGGGITAQGKPVHGRGATGLAMRKYLQMVFQDPYSSLNPRMTIGALLEEPLIIHKLGDAAERQRRIQDLLGRVGLPGNYAQRYPHQLSGGQRQRIGIARALAVEPKIIVCDEPVSSLDVSVQAQIINLLQDTQRALGVSYVFIAHNLAVVKHIADRVAVMYLGRIIEMGDKADIFANPLHPYTRMLLASVPQPHPDDRPSLHEASDLPSPLNIPDGCRFQTRCPYVQDRCRKEDPVLHGAGHAVACHFAQDIGARVDPGSASVAVRPRKAHVVRVLNAFEAMARRQAEQD